MRKNLFFIGIIFLGVSMIISSTILAKAISEDNLMTGVLNGTLSTYDSIDEDKDILMTYDAGVMLGYEQDALIQDIEDGKLEGLPYTIVGDHYVFSKKALEEWLYHRVTK